MGDCITTLDTVAVLGRRRRRNTRRQRLAQKRSTPERENPRAQAALPVQHEAKAATTEPELEQQPSAPEPVLIEQPSQETVESPEVGTDPVATNEGPPVVDPSDSDDPPRVLAVFPDTDVLRLIRESIGAFTCGVADTTPDASQGFELAMQRKYRLFFFGVDLPILSGDRLYDFIAKAYVQIGTEPRPLPAVVYVSGQLQRLNNSNGAAPGARANTDLLRDARVKGMLACPFEIARLLKFTDGVLPSKEVGK